MSRKSKSGIVNVRMVITEEKILSNIDKVQKLINPKSKKQIVQFEDDTYFKDLIESIKAYLIEYPKKKNFPVSVYKAAYELVEFATNQFEENTKKVEELIRQREENIALAGQLKDLIEVVENKTDDWKDRISEAEEEGKFSEDVIDTLRLVGKDKTRKSQNYQDAIKLLNARVNNLESNLHIEIDMERIEDKSKALSYIGIEIADALKYIPAPVEEVSSEPVQEKVEKVEVKPQEVKVAPVKAEPVQAKADVTEAKTSSKSGSNIAAATVVKPQAEAKVNPILAQAKQEKEDDQILNDMYMQETRFDVKPSLWQRFKNSKIIRTIRYIMKIRVVLEFPALPEGRGESNL